MAKTMVLGGVPWNQNGEWARGILYGLCRALRAEKFDQDIIEVYELCD